MRLVVEKAVAVPLRDGVELAADVYLPDGREPLPALVQRVPYSREASRIVDFALSVQRAVAAGYAVVVQDVRGRFASGGSFTPFLDDGRDGADTIAWTADQPWCNGRVGMIGGSYGGATQWAAAREEPPALRAIAPFVATPDCYDGWIYRDGVFELGFNLHWALRNIAPPEAARRKNGALASVLEANDATDALYRKLPLRDQPVLADLAPFYGEWLDEPEPNGRWGALRPDPQAGTSVPALSIGGWYDVFQRGTLTGFGSSPVSARRLVMGPWAHGVFGGVFPDRSFGIQSDSALVDLTALQLRWLDRWVKGDANGAEHDKPVQLFVLGANYWREGDDWPLPETDFQDLFLRSDGRANTLDGSGALSSEAPSQESADAYTYDPADPVPTHGGATFLPGLHIAANAGPRDQRPVERRRDVLCYTSEPLEAPIEAIGPVTVILHASSSALDTDFTAKLVDVAPDGFALNLTDGVIRARYRESRTSPRLLEPGRPYEFEIDLGGVANVFAVGHRIRLEISSGNFPRFDRNPQTGERAAAAHELRSAVNRVYHDRARPSRLVLPVVPAGHA